MIRAAVRELRAHTARVALTVLTIALAVAFVVGSWVVGDSVQRARTGVDLRTDFDVQAYRADGPELGDRDVAAVAALPGVAAAVGVVRGPAAVLGSGGTVVGTGDYGGISWTGRRNLELTAGRAPRGSGEVALNERTARDAGLAVGAGAGVLPGAGGRRNLRVVGLFAYRPLGLDSAPVLAVDPAFARELLGTGYTTIEVAAAPGTDARRLAEAVTATLPQAYVMTRADIAAEIRTAAAEEAMEVRAFLLGFAALALLVGSFLIVNTFAVLATARTRQYALLRAVGATPAQVRRGVLAEAAVLGVFGSTIGVLLGVGLGYAAVQALRPAGEIIAFAASPWGVLAGYAVGLLATVAAAYSSARRSAAVPPVVALRADPRVPAAPRRLRRRTGLVLLVGGVLAVLGTAGADPDGVGGLVAAGAAVTMLLGVLLLTPAVLPWLLRPVDRRSSRTGATAVRLAVRNAGADPGRSAATASALLLGVALVGAVSTVGATMVTDLTEEIRAAVPPSTVVVSAGRSGGFLGPDAMPAARRVPGRGAVLGLRQAQATVGDVPGWVTAVDPAGIGTVVRPDLVRGRADLAGGILLPLEYAEQLGVDVGDVLALRVGEDARTVPVRLPVTGVYRDGEVLFGAVIAESAVAAALPERYRAIYLGPAPGTSAAALRAATRQAFAGQPDAAVTDVEGLLDDLTAGVDLDFALLYGLLGAVILVAVAGVVNTMVLAVLERTGEIGVLRALGASRRLVARMVRCEALLLCGAGGLLALAVGLPLGAVFQHLLLDRPLWRFTVPWAMVAAVSGGVLVAALLAAAWPARRAAATDPLVAIAAGD